MSIGHGLLGSVFDAVVDGCTWFAMVLSCWTWSAASLGCVCLVPSAVSGSTSSGSGANLTVTRGGGDALASRTGESSPIVVAGECTISGCGVDNSDLVGVAALWCGSSVGGEPSKSDAGSVDPKGGRPRIRVLVGAAGSVAGAAGTRRHSPPDPVSHFLPFPAPLVLGTAVHP